MFNWENSQIYGYTLDQLGAKLACLYGVVELVIQYVKERSLPGYSEGNC